MSKEPSDFLNENGMSPEEQHGAVMRASAVPVSELEGNYPAYKTTTKGASMLSKVMFESQMRKEMN
jgi:hypothetical protein